MHIRIDLSTVPPVVSLQEPEDFKAFKAVVVHGAHMAVPVEELRALAGPLGATEAWSTQLDGMLGYAASKGWRDEQGAVLAHIEHEHAPDAG